jgi:putative tributyrin esterase
MAVIRMNFLSKKLNMQTNVTICLPSYSFADRMQGREDVYVPGMKYQVLWLLHGGTGDDSDYLHFSNIVRYADDNKLAVVMPADYNASYTDDPQGAKYYTYVVEELPKMCRAFFPFSDKREDNFIAGLSMGAGGAFKCAVAHPEMYGAALCMSGGGRGPEARNNVDRTPLPRFAGAADDPVNDPWNYVAEQVKKGLKMPKFFFTCGTEDELAYPDYLTTSQKLIDLGCDVYREEVPGYGHEWDFWDLTLRKAIKEWLPIRHSVIYPNE